MRYLLDTNICVYILREQPAAVGRRFQALSVGEACVSVVSYAELRAGVERQVDTRQHDERVLDMLFRKIKVLPSMKRRRAATASCAPLSRTVGATPSIG